jgi:hypothetical protein
VGVHEKIIIPDKVLSYGNQTQEIFGRLIDELVQLVDAVGTVAYFGPNAVEFKTRAGQMAAEFANAANKDLASIADVVSKNASDITRALGGKSFKLSVDGSPILPPVPPVVDYVKINLEELRALKDTVATRFGNVVGGFESHQRALSGLVSRKEWYTDGSIAAEAMVTRFTSGATQKANEAKTSINNFITEQIDAG